MDIIEITKLGREKIINLAVEQIKREIGSDFDIKNYDRIKVLKNDKQVTVIFDMSIKYVPFNSCFIYGIVVEFGDVNQVRPTIDPNPPELRINKPVLFKHTEESKKAVNFVIQKATENRKLSENETIRIIENEDHYRIWQTSRTPLVGKEEIFGDSTEYEYYCHTMIYKMKKTSGEIYTDGINITEIREMIPKSKDKEIK